MNVRNNTAGGSGQKIVVILVFFFVSVGAFINYIVQGYYRNIVFVGVRSIRVICSEDRFLGRFRLLGKFCLLYVWVNKFVSCYCCDVFVPVLSCSTQNKFYFRIHEKISVVIFPHPPHFLTMKPFNVQLFCKKCLSDQCKKGKKVCLVKLPTLHSFFYKLLDI
jgi:hypothetical protein